MHGTQRGTAPARIVIELVLGLLLFLWLRDASSQTCTAAVKASIRYGQGLVFCHHCENPSEQGSYAETWESHFGPKHYHVIGDVFYAVPNDARYDIMNKDEVKGNIVFIDRGEVPIVTKILRAQEVGAKAVIIVDNGKCRRKFECGLLGSKDRGNFAQGDVAEGWREVAIPAVFIMQTDGERIRSLMELTTLEIEGLGKQYLHPEAAGS